MTKKVKKYTGKLTKQILRNIRDKMILKVIKKPLDRLAQQLYQKMVESCPDLPAQMKVLDDPVMKDYVYPSYRVCVAGSVTNERSHVYFAYAYIDLPYPYAKKGGVAIRWDSQEYFDRHRFLMQKKDDICNFFSSSKLKHFTGKSLNNFFEYFPQLEEYYKPEETTSTLAPHRSPVPAGLIDEVTERITQLLTPLPEEEPEKPKKSRRKKDAK